MQELFEEIRRDAEDDGYHLTDEEFEKLVRYAKRKALVSGKNEAYVPYLLPDVIKEYFGRRAINTLTFADMRFERDEQEDKGNGRNDRKTVAFRGAEFNYQGTDHTQSGAAGWI